MTHHESEIGCLHWLYEAGTATEAEEQRLRMLLAKADAATLPPELRLLRRMFDGLAALAAETVPAAEPRAAAETISVAEAMPAADATLVAEAALVGETMPAAAPKAAAKNMPAAATLRKAASVPLCRDVRPLRRIAGWGAVAAVVALGAVTIGHLCTPYGYVDGRAIYDRDEALAETACLARLEALDRSMTLFDALIPLSEQQPEKR